MTSNLKMGSIKSTPFERHWNEILMNNKASAPFFSNISKSRFFWVVFFITIAFVIYSYGLIDAPKRDHRVYMHERMMFSNTWDWFWHSVSFNRTRVYCTGDYYLFRPAHMAVLAIIDIFFRGNNTATGLFSIFFVGFSAFCLSELIALLLNKPLGVLFGLTFLSNYAGMELVLWRHISPYILAIGFFALACRFIYQSEQSMKKKLAAGVCLLVGALFHESVAYASILASLIFAALYLFYTVSKTKTTPLYHSNLRSYLLICALPSLAFIGLDILDMIIHPVSVIPELYGQLKVSVLSDNQPHNLVKEGLGALALVHEAFSTAAFFPFLTKLIASSGFWVWHFRPHSWYLVITGLSVFSIIACGIFPTLKACYQKRAVATDAIMILSVCLYVTIVSAIGLVRVLVRTIGYIFAAPYYYAFATGALCIVIALCLYNILGMIKRYKVQQNLKIFVGGGLLFIFVLQSLSIFNLLHKARLVSDDYRDVNIYYSAANKKYYGIDRNKPFNLRDFIKHPSSHPSNQDYFIEANSFEEISAKNLIKKGPFEF